MFFELSKIFWFLAAPSSLLVLLLTVAAIGQFTAWRRTARAASVVAALLYGIVALLPVGTLLMGHLENRFPRPPANMPAPDGVIVLGGGMDELITTERDLAQLNDSGSRMTQAALLARRYPQARLVFAGGSARLTPTDFTESDAARRFFADEGIAPERISYDDQSRNTWENAINTRELAKPKSGEHWLLVTSAFHMPRAVGIFRRVNFDLTPWPADYVTRPGSPRLAPNFNTARAIYVTDRALREYAGLLVYYVTDKTSALFPAP